MALVPFRQWVLPRCSSAAHPHTACPIPSLPPPRSILFPLPIMALVPLRQWVLPRCFANPRHLQELDAGKEEEAAPLPHQQALQVGGG